MSTTLSEISSPLQKSGNGHSENGQFHAGNKSIGNTQRDNTVPFTIDELERVDPDKKTYVMHHSLATATPADILKAASLNNTKNT